MASQAFDVSEAIQAFVADKTRISMEFPHMTNGQRKQAKRVIEQYPELTCESYGLGQERRIHVFKGREKVTAVQNEIVVGEIGGKGIHKETHESPVAIARSPALSHILEVAERKRENESPSTAASDHSVTPSTTPSPRLAQSGSSSPAQSGLATPVFNTFIHYAHSADTRAIQSMPHGMFGQSLINELCTDAAAKRQNDAKLTPYVAAELTLQEPRHTTCVSPLSDLDDDEDVWAPGTEVLISGLAKLPAFNGLKGTIQSFDEEAGRFNVLLSDAVGARKWVKVKRENLNSVVSLPPLLSPSWYSSEVPVTPTWEESHGHTFY